jgi:hypothetical protein
VGFPELVVQLERVLSEVYFELSELLLVEREMALRLESVCLQLVLAPENMLAWGELA